MLSERLGRAATRFLLDVFTPRIVCNGGVQLHSIGIAMLDCSPLTVYAVTITERCRTHPDHSRCEESPDVTVIFAVCEPPERKSTTEAFSALPVSTEHLLSATSTSQARNT